MICLHQQLWFLMYRFTTSSSTLPTVSAKYPSAQKLSPHKNSSSSGNSFRIIRLVPPFSICVTSATLSFGFVCITMCTRSSWILISLIHHLFILQASYSNRFRRMTILPFSTRFLYLGIHTKWYCKRCFVWAPVLYLDIVRSCQNYLRFASKSGSAPGGHSSPGLKAWGFLADFIMTLINYFAFTIFPAEFLELSIIDISETIIVFTSIPAEMRSHFSAISVSIIIVKSCWFRSLITDSQTGHFRILTGYDHSGIEVDFRCSEFYTMRLEGVG